MTYRLDNSIILKIITREKPVEREIVKKKIKKEERIKRTPLKRIKIKIRNRIKNNLVNLVEKKPSTLITFLPDFARKISAINI